MTGDPMSEIDDPMGKITNVYLGMKRTRERTERDGKTEKCYLFLCEMTRAVGINPWALFSALHPMYARLRYVELGRNCAEAFVASG